MNVFIYLFFGFTLRSILMAS